VAEKCPHIAEPALQKGRTRRVASCPSCPARDTRTWFLCCVAAHEYVRCDGYTRIWRPAGRTRNGMGRASSIAPAGRRDPVDAATPHVRI